MTRVGLPAVRATYTLPVLLGAAVFLIAQPSIFGEGRSAVALALATVLVIVTILSDGMRSAISRGSGTLLALMFAVIVWTLFVTASQTHDAFGPLLNGAAVVMIALFGTALLFSKTERAVGFARIMLVVVAVMSLSSAVTVAMALASTAFVVAEIPIRDVTAVVYFPFTPTLSSQMVLGVELPRFTGIAREPGWMAMFAASAWFLWPMAFAESSSRVLKSLRIALILGILTPISTGGFGVAVVVMAVTVILTPTKSARTRPVKVILGIGAAIFAVWVAVAAPVLGLASKSDQNALSLEERSRVTQQGIDALLQLSLGAPSSERTANINMLAAVTENGWPYIMLLSAAILAPLLTIPRYAIPRAAPPILVVYLTLLLTQPPNGAIGAYVVVLLACALAGREPAHSHVRLANRPSLGGRKVIPDPVASRSGLLHG